MPFASMYEQPPAGFEPAGGSQIIKDCYIKHMPIKNRFSKVCFQFLFIGIFLVCLSTPPTALFAQESPPAIPRFEPDECPVAVPDHIEVECGYLLVKENRQALQPKILHLAVAIIKSPNPNLHLDPIIYLAGGPGGASLIDLEYWADFAIQTNRDFILFDTRGTGFSRPIYTCDQFDYMENIVRAASDCRSDLQQTKVAFASYTSATIAQDVEDLRRVLGYEVWNVYGISYGTRVALTLLRDYPEHIRSIVLDSAVPLQVNVLEDQGQYITQTLDRLFETCQQTPDCHAEYPALEIVFYELIERINNNPVRTTGIDPASANVVSIELDGDTILHTVLQALSAKELVPFLPWAIYQFQGGNYLPLTQLTLWLNVPSGVEEWVYYAVVCQEELPFHNQEQLQQEIAKYSLFINYAHLDDWFNVCKLWGTFGYEVDPVENEAVQGDVPTLLLAGSYDAITPPEWTALAASTLNNSYLYEFPNLGHAVSTSHSCPWAMTNQFWDDPHTKPDVACYQEMKNFSEFTLPSNLVSTDVIDGLWAKFYQPKTARLNFWAWLLLLVFGSGAILFPLTAHWIQNLPGFAPDVPLRPDEKNIELLAFGAITFLSLLNLFFLLGIIAVDKFSIDNTYLFLGVPVWASPLLWIPTIAQVLLLLSLGLGPWVGQKRFWSVLHRWHYFLLLIAGAGFQFFLRGWHL